MSHPQEKRTGKVLGKSDWELILEFQKGSPESFEMLYRRHVQPIFRYVFHMVRRRESAEDLTQEIFLQLYRKAHLYKPTGKFSSWLYKIAKNSTLKFIKKNRDLHEAHSLDLPVGESGSFREISVEDQNEKSGPFKTAVSREECEIVRKALIHLEPSDREILILCDINEVPHKDVAEMVGVSVGNLNVRLHRARLKLAKILELSDKTAEERTGP